MLFRSLTSSILMTVSTKLLVNCIPFLLNACSHNLTRKQLISKANQLNDIVLLMMHGIPYDLVKKATQDQIDVLTEIVQRDMKSQSALLAHDIAKMFGMIKD